MKSKKAPAPARSQSAAPAHAAAPVAGSALKQGLLTFLRVLLGGLLLWAGASKVSNPVVFLGDIMAYRLPLPASWLSATAVSLPWMEILCGVMLVTRTRLHGALLFGLALFAIFDLVTAQAVVRGLDIDCGCFNAEALKGLHLEGWVSTVNSVGFAFGRDLVLTAAILWLLVESPEVRRA